MEKHALFRKGINAAAYLDNELFCECILKINVNTSERQANVMLIFPLNVHNDQRIILVFDATNIVPGTIKFCPASMPNPQWSRIARQEGNELTAFSFDLQRRGVLLCPPNFQRDDSKPDIQRLESVAMSMSICIVSDLHGWLSKDKWSQFRSWTAKSATSSEFPRVKPNSTLVEVEDWNKLPKKDPLASGDSLENDEAPPTEAPPTYRDETLPSYTPASLKRPRQSPGSPPAPCSRRRLSHSTIEPLSPTEKATTITPSPSPRPVSRSPSPSFIQKEIRNAVGEQLPGVVAKLLSEAAAPKPSPSFHSSIPSSRHSTPASLNATSSKCKQNWKELHDRLTTDVENETYYSAKQIMDTFANEMEEDFADQRAELNIMKQDQYEELERHCNKEMGEIAERLGEMKEEFLEDIHEALDQANADVCDLMPGQQQRMDKSEDGQKRMDKQLKEHQQQMETSDAQQQELVKQLKDQQSQIDKLTRLQKLMFRQLIEQPRQEKCTGDKPNRERGQRARSLPTMTER